MKGEGLGREVADPAATEAIKEFLSHDDSTCFTNEKMAKDANEMFILTRKPLMTCRFGAPSGTRTPNPLIK
ncbi:MAG TPA: hypothetical protein VFR23_04280, partial [Jiangellaceae bacterium]|nr:hypothetical protein [Jiangellaceae bacterium]